MYARPVPHAPRVPAGFYFSLAAQRALGCIISSVCSDCSLLRPTAQSCLPPCIPNNSTPDNTSPGGPRSSQTGVRQVLWSRDSLLIMKTSENWGHTLRSAFQPWALIGRLILESKRPDDKSDQYLGCSLFPRLVQTPGTRFRI